MYFWWATSKLEGNLNFPLGLADAGRAAEVPGRRTRGPQRFDLTRRGIWQIWSSGEDFKALGLTVLVLQTGTHVARNPRRGTDTCKLKQPRSESERACVCERNLAKLQHYLQTTDQKVAFVSQSKAALLLRSTLPFLQARSPLLNQILSSSVS